jgi:hypothetical protein
MNFFIASPDFTLFIPRTARIPKVISLLAIALFISLQSSAQSERILSGHVTDASNGEAIPFATVTLKKSLIGTITNEFGKFDLHIPAEITDDQLIVTLIGFQYMEFPLSSLTSPVSVKLSPVAIDMKEVLIKPQPPTYYITLAMRSLKSNYPSKPFETQSYYRENIKENENYLRGHEGVFKSYYPAFQDSSKNQHKLILFRKAETISELAFMKKERLKDEAKEKKKEAKAIKKGKAVPKKEADEDSLKIGEVFGGPDNLLKMADLFRGADNFLDTTQFKNYTYSFAKSSSFNNAALMVIQFKSRGKVDHTREEGKIYIDIASNAIVKIESKGTYVIPTLIRPVLFVMGIGVENPKFVSSLEFQEIDNLWYPKNMQYNLDMNVEKKRMFAANDNSNFKIFGFLTVNKLNTTSATAVPAAKRFKSDKKPEEQVYNDEQLNWSEINMIKR